MEGAYSVGNFEFRSPHERPHRIPVSKTGYRSHFAPMLDIETEASPQESARCVALGFPPPRDWNGGRLALF